MHLKSFKRKILFGFSFFLFTFVCQAKEYTALALSGGVSLGSHQAGFLQAFCAHQQQQGNKMPLVLVGASAGALNAFATGYYSFFPIPAHPESSFFSGWIRVGLPELEGGTVSSIFQRRAIESMIQDLFKAWFSQRPPLSENRSLIFGITVTRVNPRQLVLGAVRIPKQDEKFVIKITWNPLLNEKTGKSGFWSLTNVLAGDLGNGMVLLGPEFDLEFNPEEFQSSKVQKSLLQLSRLVYASSSFPIAFEPVNIEHSVLDTALCLEGYQASEQRVSLSNWKSAVGRSISFEKLERDCPQLSFKKDTAAFVDGGLFDNNPLRLALRLTEPNENSVEEKEQQILFVDPHVTTFSRQKESGDVGGEAFLDRWPEFFEQLYWSNFKRELAMARGEMANPGSRVSIAPVRFPLCSSHLSDFLGFIDEGFRRFDFYAGQADAMAFLKDKVWEFKSPEIPIHLTDVDSVRFSILLRSSQEMLSLYHEAFSMDTIPTDPVSILRQSNVEMSIGKLKRQHLLRLVSERKNLRAFLEILGPEALNYPWKEFGNNNALSYSSVMAHINRSIVSSGTQMAKKQKDKMGPLGRMALARTIQKSVSVVSYGPQTQYWRFEFGTDGFFINSLWMPKNWESVLVPKPQCGLFFRKLVDYRDNGRDDAYPLPNEIGPSVGLIWHIPSLGWNPSLFQLRSGTQMTWVKNFHSKGYSSLKTDFHFQGTLLDVSLVTIGWQWKPLSSDPQIKGEYGPFWRIGFQF